MKILLALILAVFFLPASTLYSQAVRVDPNPASTVAVGAGPGQTAPLLAIPNANVSLCGYPAQGFPCTNLATTYTDASATVACPNNAQVVVPGSASCSAVTDGQGNFGFWVTPGMYTYMEQWGGATYGPFPITVPGAGNNATYLQGTPVSAAPPQPGQVITNFTPGSYTPYWGCFGIPAAAYGTSPTAVDNIPALNAALNAAAASGAGNVCVGPGTLQIQSPLDIPTKVHLQGTGRGDAGVLGQGGTNTVLQAGANFPQNSPLVTFSTVAGQPRFGTQISDLSLDCNNVAGCGGLQDNYGEEQSGGHRLLIENAGAYCIQINGADSPSTGRSQNSWGYEDIECFPNNAANANFVGIDARNNVEGFGLRRISIVGMFGHPFNYAMILSGNNFHVESIHIEQATVAGVLLNPGGTPYNSVGASSIFIDNVVMSTGSSGVPVEIAYNAQNTASGIEVFNATANSAYPVCGSVKNDATGQCDFTPVYIAGGQQGGTPNTLDLGYKAPWRLTNPISNYSSYTSINDGTNPGFDLKNGDTYLGWPLFAGPDGTLDMGGAGVEGAKDLNIHNPGMKLCIDSSGSNACMGLNLQGVLTPDYTDAMMLNSYFQPADGTFHVIGDGSGWFGGIMGLNPGGPQNLASVYGGIGIFSAWAQTTPENLTPEQMAQHLTVSFPGSGGVRLNPAGLQTTPPGCANSSDGILFFVPGGSGVKDTLEVCAKDATGNYAWRTIY